MFFVPKNSPKPRLTALFAVLWPTVPRWIAAKGDAPWIA